MNRSIPFRSIFTPYFIGFLEMKGVMNFSTKRFRIFFLELDSFFIETNVTDVHISKEHISVWRSTQLNAKRTTLYSKYSMFRQFCQYICHTGQECYIPLLPKYVRSDFVPYIFTHKQMKLIFESCDELTMPDRRMTCILFALPALFRFLYSTGVRINEALSLKNEDMNFESNQIVLKKTKNQIHRLIPVNASLLAVLMQYKEYRGKMPLHGLSAPDSFFFVSPVGKPLSECAVLYWFKRILRNCGISNASGIRVHDVRHSAAVHSLIKMVSNGIDIYCALPILSVFLGHRTIESTERYVRLTQEMYPEVLKMEQVFTSFVFPKVNIKIEFDYDNN
jgi:integrase